MQTELFTQRSYSQRYRSIFSFCLAIIMLLVVGCSSAQPAPPVYSPDKADLIREYSSGLKELRTRVDELPALIADENWPDVENLIHGPLGELRFRMLNVARNLPAELESKARSLSKDVFQTLVEIDASAQVRNESKAVEGYNALIDKYEEFIELIPSDEAMS